MIMTPIIIMLTVMTLSIMAIRVLA
jgi:hypothetical protein